MSSVHDASAPTAGKTAAKKPGSCGPIAVSNKTKIRGLVLVGVHVAAFLHLAHWKIAGTTLTPVEPSESMQTLELGYVNAGFILFALALLATLVFGRFFCGWGCHVVALQDACGWLMTKAGVRPRPFRSRLLAYVPLIAGVYMFVWPTLKRYVNFADFVPDLLRRILDWPTSATWFDVYRKPDWKPHLFTDDVWRTFPGWTMGLLTLFTAGPLIVWFLGNKGFCTYGCPYGGLFGVVDRFAPMRVRVTDACEGCGHCTAVCTSNIRVHEEVRLFKAVVDPQCMKCMDCVDVCPKDALYVGFGPPAVLTKASPAKPRRTFDLSLTEELVLAVVFAAAVFAFRSLYDQVPFLMALALAAILSFSLRVLWKMLLGRPTAIQNVKLTEVRRPTRAGLLLGGALAVFVAFGAHSFLVQYHDTAGRYYLREHNVLVDAGKGQSTESRDLLVSSAEHLDRAVDMGLLPMRTIALASARSWFKLNAFDRAVARFAPLLAEKTETPEDLLMLAIARGQTGDVKGGIADVESYLRLRPDNQAARSMLLEMKKSLGG